MERVHVPVPVSVGVPVVGSNGVEVVDSVQVVGSNGVVAVDSVLDGDRTDGGGPTA